MLNEEEIIREHQQILDLAKSNKKRIDTLEEGVKELRKLAEAVASMVTEQKNMREDLSEMKADVKVIKEKPAKRMDNLTEKVIELIIAGVVGFMLANLGL